MSFTSLETEDLDECSVDFRNLKRSCSKTFGRELETKPHRTHSRPSLKITLNDVWLAYCCTSPSATDDQCYELSLKLILVVSDLQPFVQTVKILSFWKLFFKVALVVF